MEPLYRESLPGYPLMSVLQHCAIRKLSEKMICSYDALFNFLFRSVINHHTKMTTFKLRSSESVSEKNNGPIIEFERSVRIADYLLGFLEILRDFRMYGEVILEGPTGKSDTPTLEIKNVEDKFLTRHVWKLSHEFIVY